MVHKDEERNKYQFYRRKCLKAILWEEEKSAHVQENFSHLIQRLGEKLTMSFKDSFSPEFYQNSF
jgi:hypothetical protein